MFLSILMPRCPSTPKMGFLSPLQSFSAPSPVFHHLSHACFWCPPRVTILPPARVQHLWRGPYHPCFLRSLKTPGYLFLPVLPSCLWISLCHPGLPVRHCVLVPPQLFVSIAATVVTLLRRMLLPLPPKLLLAVRPSISHLRPNTVAGVFQFSSVILPIPSFPTSSR